MFFSLYPPRAQLAEAIADDGQGTSPLPQDLQIANSILQDTIQRLQQSLALGERVNSTVSACMQACTLW